MYICICIYVYMYMYMYICVCIYVYTYSPRLSIDRSGVLDRRSPRLIMAMSKQVRLYINIL